MEKVRSNQGGIAICVRLRTEGRGLPDFPHFSAYVLCGWPLKMKELKLKVQLLLKIICQYHPLDPLSSELRGQNFIDCWKMDNIF